MTTSVLGYCFFTAPAVENTSCTNGIPYSLEIPKPAEPVIATRHSFPFKIDSKLLICSKVFSLTLEK